MDKDERAANRYASITYLDFGDLNEKAEAQIKKAFSAGMLYQKNRQKSLERFENMAKDSEQNISSFPKKS